MPIRRASLLLAAVLFVSACGGGGVIQPPAPPPSGTGTVTGTVAVTATAAPSAAPGPVRPARSSATRPALVPDRLMVKFRPGVSAPAAAAVHGQARATVLHTIERLNVQVVRLAPGASAEAALAAYRTSGQVEYAEQDRYAYAQAIPNDPIYSSQWHYPAIGLPSAWDTTTGGGVIVAVLDTGIRFDHPDLVGVTTLGSGPVTDFVTDTSNGDGDGRDNDPTDPGCSTAPSELSHGTHVAGTVAARTNNGQGVAGVNWGGVSPTRVMPLRVLDGCGTGLYSDIADAITYAADHGAKVINMSLGGSPGSTTVDNAIAYARGLGVTLVAAAGNGGCAAVLYPARNANVIAVAATNINNQRASYSNCGPEIDVAAPGGDSAGWVWSTTWSPNAGNVYAGFSGTSMATPHVAGLAALMISRGITGPATIQTTLENTALDLGTVGRDNEFGAGLVQAAAAIGGGTAASRLRAFSGLISGSMITVQSNVVVVPPNGTFTITNAQAGTKSVFLWQDFNGNSVIDTGDTYARVNNVVITDGGNTNIGTVTVSRYSGAPITVTDLP
ncbi:MAG: S8 family peptidase [Armatimonadota bacterium]|nr:S8 family peptidase [Armatimonadota bacterium]